MAMPGVPAAVRKVDAAVLEAAILQPMLGLLDAEQFAASDAVQYVRELGAATAPVERGEAAAAFLLRAPTLEQVRAVADAGAVMPQKSTYFFPKLWSGFLLNPWRTGSPALARLLPAGLRRRRRGPRRASHPRPARAGRRAGGGR